METNDLNKLTFSELKMEVEKLDKKVFGEYVIVRTYSAGVFAGNIKTRHGKEVILVNARRLWYWKGAASLSQLAMEGVKNPSECNFHCEVDEVILTEVIEILNTTKAAESNIKEVPIWKK